MPHEPRRIRKQQLLPRTDLVLEEPPPGKDIDYKLFDDVNVVLALLTAGRTGEPVLLDADSAGRLKVTADTTAPANVRIQDSATTSLAKVTSQSLGDGQNADIFLQVGAWPFVFNGTQWDRVRSASAANLIAQSGLGAGLVAPPGMWSVVHTPAAGAQATASKVAGAAGVRHVCTGIVVTFGAIAAPVAAALTWNLRDGATGAGTILASGQIAVPAAVFQGQPIVLSGLCIPGTAATAMTLEFSALLANLLEGVTLLGFDAS